MFGWIMQLLLAVLGITLLLIVVLLIAVFVGYVVWGRYTNWRLLRLFPIVFEQVNHCPDEQMILQSKEMKRFSRLLRQYTLAVVGPYDRNAERMYTRVDPCLLYNIKQVSGNQVAFFHMRSSPPESLREKFKIHQSLDAFIHFTDEVLSQGKADRVEAITHQHLFSKRAVERKVLPRLHAMGYETSFEPYDNSYLIHIYCEFLMIYGMDLMETAAGIRLLRSVQEIVRLSIWSMQEQAEADIKELTEL